MLLRVWCLAVWLTGMFFGATAAAAPSDFEEAKRLAERVYSTHPQEFYCGCRITWSKSGKDVPQHDSCGYRIRKDVTRAKRIEWEHVVPASWFGQPLACWKQGGRERCSRQDKRFQAMEGDLHNLTPAIGEVNADRGNLPFGVVAAGSGRYGQCQTRVDLQRGFVEPRDEVKGDVARIVFYMMDRYQVKVDSAQRALLVQWNEQDPVDAWEKQRDVQIGQHMGWRNPFVAKAGTVAIPEASAGVRTVGGWIAGEAARSDVQQAGQDNAASKPPVVGMPGAKASSGHESGVAEIRKVRGNRNSRKFHLQGCPGYDLIGVANRVDFASVNEAQAQGYKLAGNCR